MSRIQCFLIEDAGVCHRYLRRSSVGSCPARGGSYHDAAVFLDEAPTPRTPDGYVDCTIKWAADDPRWPTACACGYVFTADDRQDLFVFDLWKRADGQPGLFTVHGSPYPQTERAPAGSMWDAWWNHTDSDRSWAGADGLSLCVMLPDGVDWCMDIAGHTWTREGTPPNVTARPSILSPGYHGFLTNGALESC